MRNVMPKETYLKQEWTYSQQKNSIMGNVLYWCKKRLNLVGNQFRGEWIWINLKTCMTNNTHIYSIKKSQRYIND